MKEKSTESLFWSYGYYDHPIGVRGALVRVEDGDGFFGMADLCPWTHLGDQDLTTEIRSKGPLLLRSQELALEDLRARREQRTLYSNQSIKNHILVRDWKSFSFESLLEDSGLKSSVDSSLHVNQNLKTLYKFKCGSDYLAFAAWLNEHADKFSLIRIDFNAQLSPVQFREFLNNLKDIVIKKIDFIEDPCPFSDNEWKEFSKIVKIASDFEGIDFPVRVNKPAREAFDPQAVCITSAMDHPVGHMHALRFAQQRADQIHGFSTIELFKTSPYYKYFHLNTDTLTLKNEGFGIGLDSALMKESYVPSIDWENPTPTQLLLDPGLPFSSRLEYFKLTQKFAADNPENYLLLSSSGSTGHPDEQKLYAFTKVQVRAAAKRVIHHFKLRLGAVMGSVLPYFHVAGLSTLARAFELQSPVIHKGWKDVTREWFEQNKIEVISLVPTQIFDIVQRNWTCPSSVTHVFVGAGALSKELYDKSCALGWPIIATYGMTETVGMIAVADFKNEPLEYELVKGVEFDDHAYASTQSPDNRDNSVRQVRASGIASYLVLGVKGELRELIHFNDNHQGMSPRHLELPDLIEQVGSRRFRLIGRKDEQIKIKGELVNLVRIRMMIHNVFQAGATVVDLDDRRTGKRLVLVADKSTLGDRAQKESLELEIQKINQNLKSFERISYYVVIEAFPRTALDKIRIQEIKSNFREEDIYEIRKF